MMQKISFDKGISYDSGTWHETWEENKSRGDLSDINDSTIRLLKKVVKEYVPAVESAGVVIHKSVIRISNISRKKDSDGNTTVFNLLVRVHVKSRKSLDRNVIEKIIGLYEFDIYVQKRCNKKPIIMIVAHKLSKELYDIVLL